MCFYFTFPFMLDAHMVSKSPRYMIYLFPPFSHCVWMNWGNPCFWRKKKTAIGGNNYFNKINFVLIKNPPLQFQTTENKIFAIFLLY